MSDVVIRHSSPPRPCGYDMCESVDAIGDEPQAIWHCDIFEYDPVNVFDFRQITKKWDDVLWGSITPLRRKFTLISRAPKDR
jgi:hypothetical protein